MPAPVEPPPFEWRVGGGAQIDADSHGVLDVGVRRGRWSASILTDTLELRLDPAWEQGRAWVALRGELGAAGLMISPWRDGSPDPSRALSASYLGAETGVVTYLPAGMYIGGSLVARQYAFGAMSETTVPVPGARTLISGDAVWGIYRGDGHVWVQAGVSVPEPSAHVSGEAVWRPIWRVSPWVEGRAGAASNTDDVTRTRLGGLNPYVVPLAGAAWGEWWVDNYAAARVGPALHFSPGDWALGVAPVLDAAVFTVVLDTRPADRQSAVGVAGIVHASRRRFESELSVGDAPWIERGPGVSRVSVWLRVGLDWGVCGWGTRGGGAPPPTLGARHGV